MLLASLGYQFVSPAKSALILTASTGLIAALSGILVEKWKGAHVTGLTVIGFFCGMLAARLPALHLKTMAFPEKFPGFILSVVVALASATALIVLLRNHLDRTTK